MSGESEMPLPPDVVASVEQTATDLDTAGSWIATTQVAADTVSGVPGWCGTAAASYSDSVMALGSKARDWAGSFAGPAAALRTWGEAVTTMRSTTVPGYWDEYDQAQTTYDNGIAALHREKSQRSGTEYEMTPDEIAERRVTLVTRRDDEFKRILDEYKKSMDTLDDAAQTAANALTGAVDALVPTANQASRNAVGAALFDDIPLVDGQAEWEYAQEIAPVMARDLRDTDLTHEEVQAIYDKYGTLLSNPFVAHALMEELSVEEVYQFTVLAGGDRFLGRSAEELAVHHALLTQLGTAVVIATGGSIADGSGLQLAFETARDGLLGKKGRTMDQIIEGQLAESEDSNLAYDPVTGAPASGESPAYIDGYSVFTQLIGAAGSQNPNLTLGPGFYDESDGASMATMLVEWDHAKGEGTRAAAIGAMEIPPAGAVLVGTDASVMDPMHSIYLLSDTPDSLAGAEADPVLVQAEEARLEAMRRFLTSETSFKVDGAPMDMTRYLTGHRVEGDFMGFQDGGEAFGDMLADASAPDPNADLSAPDPANYPQGESDPAYKKAYGDFEARRDDDARRAQIAANFMSGYQDGLDSEHDDAISKPEQVDGQDVYGHTNSALRSWAGTIVAPHIEGLADSMQQQGTSDSPGGTEVVGGHAEMTFSTEDTNRFMAAGGFFEDLAFDAPELIDEGDPDNPLDDVYENGRRPAIETLRIAAYEGYVKGLAEAGDINTRDAQLSEYIAQANKWAPITNSLYIAKADAGSAAAEAMDARNQAWQDGVGAVIDLVPFSDLIDSKLTNYAIDQAKTHLVPPILEARLSTDHASQASTGQAQRHDVATQTLLDGMYEVLSHKPTWFSASGAPIEFSEPNLKSMSFVDGDGPMAYEEMNEDQREQYEKWLTNNTDYKKVIDGVSAAMTEAESVREKANEAISGTASEG